MEKAYVDLVWGWVVLVPLTGYEALLAEEGWDWEMVEGGRCLLHLRSFRVEVLSSREESLKGIPLVPVPEHPPDGANEAVRRLERLVGPLPFGTPGYIITADF